MTSPKIPEGSTGGVVKPELSSDADAAKCKLREEMRAEFALPEDYDGPVEQLPLLDESVMGYPDDTHPYRGGQQEILDVVECLKKHDIPSFLVDNAALIYFGFQG
jgi:hypothetical protein